MCTLNLILYGRHHKCLGSCEALRCPCVLIENGFGFDSLRHILFAEWTLSSLRSRAMSSKLIIAIVVVTKQGIYAEFAGIGGNRHDIGLTLNRQQLETLPRSIRPSLSAVDHGQLFMSFIPLTCPHAPTLAVQE
jgi:hypothetical protein